MDALTVAADNVARNLREARAKKLSVSFVDLVVEQVKATGVPFHTIQTELTRRSKIKRNNDAVKKAQLL